jgi:putative flippase GtrA
MHEAHVAPGRRTTVEVVLPVYNEERDLAWSVRRLRAYLDDRFPFDAVVTIADNASTDGTWDVATALAESLPGVRALHLDEKGRGRALRAAWTASTSEVVAYMDVDLSTDLDALLPLIAPLASGHSDIAIGSRLAAGSRVRRGPRREVISRIYNAILRCALGNRFTDAQCGFKALRAADARLLLPAVIDNEWFFDTELLVLGERNGLRIHEVPVDWSDDPDSRVALAKTARADLRGVWRLMRSSASGSGRLDELARRREPESSELARFARVGAFSTLAYLACYLVLRTALPAVAANLGALGLCSAGNVAAHFRITFSGRGPLPRRAALVATSVGLATSAACTTPLLLVVTVLDGHSALAQIAALLVGNALAATARFVLLRAVLFHRYLRTPKGVDPATVTAETSGAGA